MHARRRASVLSGHVCVCVRACVCVCVCVRVSPQVGVQPEPREDHVASIISKYMLISGGSTQGGSKRLGDLQVR